MKITNYGICVGIAWLFFNMIVKKLTLKLISIFIISFIIQSYLCKTCDSKYTMASVMSVLPILLLFSYDCLSLKNILVAISFSFAIGRIGCYFAGCCTGPECEKTFYSIKYNDEYVVNKNTNKSTVTVCPTIILEIIIQFAIAFIVYKSKHGIVWFGILNLILMILTHQWRREPRMDNMLIPIGSLFALSLFAFFKCKTVNNYELSMQFKPYMVVIAIVLSLVISNDINIKHIL
jgi:hypothetical protein